MSSWTLYIRDRGRGWSYGCVGVRGHTVPLVVIGRPARGAEAAPSTWVGAAPRRPVGGGVPFEGTPGVPVSATPARRSLALHRGGAGYALHRGGHALQNSVQQPQRTRKLNDIVLDEIMCMAALGLKARSNPSPGLSALGLWHTRNSGLKARPNGKHMRGKTLERAFSPPLVLRLQTQGRGPWAIIGPGRWPENRRGIRSFNLRRITSSGPPSGGGITPHPSLRKELPCLAPRHRFFCVKMGVLYVETDGSAIVAMSTEFGWIAYVLSHLGCREFHNRQGCPLILKPLRTQLTESNQILWT